MNKMIIPILAITIATGCSKSSSSSSTVNNNDSTTNDFSLLYAKMYNITSIDTSSSTKVVVKTTDVPDHKSPFFGTSSPNYEAYNGDNPDFSTTIDLNGTISDPTLLSQSITFNLPRYPVVATTHSSPGGGPMGIARNGVCFYDQYNGLGAALGSLEINNADQYLGHPTPTAAGAQYHYHYEPKYLTKKFGNSAFMGFLLDGFPVYGPYENGVKITTDMLDSYNGHTSYTEDYPTKKIYHYHVISSNSDKVDSLEKAAPYINGGKYYGPPGTVN